MKSTIASYREILESCEFHFQRLQTVEVPDILRKQVPAVGDASNLLETAPCLGLRTVETYAATGLQQMESRIAELAVVVTTFLKEFDELSIGDLELTGSYFIGLESKLKVLIAKRECQYDTRKALGESGGNEERSEKLRTKMAEDDAEISKAMSPVLNSKT